MDADPSLDNYDRYDVLVGHDPSGTSVQNMAHWKQILDKK
jgi:gastric triacylglycerol lipase